MADMGRMLEHAVPDGDFRARLLEEARMRLTGIGWSLDPTPSDGNVVFPTFG